VSVPHRLLSLAVVSAAALVLSGCSVLESLGIGGSSQTVVEEGVGEETQPGQELDPAATPDPNGPSALTTPTCDTIYTPAQTNALLGEVRVSVGETTDDNYYGTFAPDLVTLLKNVRRDLKVSCVWYLPPGESTSVTTVAIVTADVATAANRSLGSAGLVREDIGGGVLWLDESATAQESPDYVASEAHFVTPVPCPASIPDTNCAVWISTHYVFGDARVLTLDAATQLGVFTG